MVANSFIARIRDISSPQIVVSGMSCYTMQEQCSLCHIINLLLTKIVRSRWLDIGVILFLRFYGPRLRLDPLKRKKRTWPISSHLDLVLGQ